MTLDEYEGMPNALRLQVAMALIQAAQEHVGHQDCQADVGLTILATFILDDYCCRRETGRGLDMEYLHDMGLDEQHMADTLASIDLVRLQ